MLAMYHDVPSLRLAFNPSVTIDGNGVDGDALDDTTVEGHDGGVINDVAFNVGEV